MALRVEGMDLGARHFEAVDRRWVSLWRLSALEILAVVKQASLEHLAWSPELQVEATVWVSNFYVKIIQKLTHL